MSPTITARKKTSPKARAAVRKRGAYHHGDLRRALVNAALALVEEQGAEAFTLREVARRAGVTHAAPYRHFSTKAALLAAVAEEGFRGLRASLETAADRAGANVLARFQGTSIGYVRFALDNPSHFRVMFGPFEALADHPGLTTATREAFEFLVNLIKACQEANDIRQGDSVEIALAAWSLIHGVATLLVNGRLEVTNEKDIDSLALRVTLLLEHGLLATPTAMVSLPIAPPEVRLPKIRGTLDGSPETQGPQRRNLARSAAAGKGQSTPRVAQRARIGLLAGASLARGRRALPLVGRDRGDTAVCRGSLGGGDIRRRGLSPPNQTRRNLCH